MTPGKVISASALVRRCMLEGPQLINASRLPTLQDNCFRDPRLAWVAEEIDEGYLIRVMYYADHDRHPQAWDRIGLRVTFDPAPGGKLSMYHY